MDLSHVTATQQKICVGYLISFMYTVQKMKFSIKDFFSKCDQIRSFLWIWSHLLKKSLMENFNFRAVESMTTSRDLTF